MSKPVRRSRRRFSLVCLALALASAPARAHELDYQELILHWDAGRSELRGQILTDPRRLTTPAAQPGARAAELLARLGESLRLELDGARCAPRLRVRELWVPAGATLGDSVLVACARARAPRTLRVYAGPWLHGLRVTVQQELGREVLSSQALVLGGAWSGVYAFADARAGFREPAAVSGSAAYLRLGLEHILAGGWDHLAFVAALVLGSSGGVGRLLVELTAFTAAHSLSLALAALGWLFLPRAPIELAIAGSVAVMALSNLRASTRGPRTAIVLAFGFGLLHGQGFAGGLLDAGLPTARLVWALLSFNLGVELGQAAWAGALWLGLCALPQGVPRARVLELGSLAIAALGLYWIWERSQALL
jgi:hypothetical protein